MVKEKKEMKLKGRISRFVCCLAVMAAIAVSTLSAQAAACKHPQYLDHPDATQTSYFDASYHYWVKGTEHICTTCGYTYWTGLRTEKGSHEYNILDFDSNHKPIYSNTCRVCGYTKGAGQ